MNYINAFIWWVTGMSRALAATNVTVPVNVITDQAGLQTLFCNIIGYFVWIVIIISVIMVLLAAYDYTTAGDDTEKTSKARKTLTYAAIGIAIALLAYSFPQIVISVIPNATTSSVFAC